MANASAFGFSGYDPVGSYFEGSINGYFDKKSEQRAYERQLALMEAQYSYAQRYAENTPSWTVKGLRAAGLNPILAVANGVHTSAQAPAVPSASSHRSPINSTASFNASGLLPFDRRMAAQNANAQTLAAQAADKQADAALLKAQTDRGESMQRVAKLMQEVEKLRFDTERSKGDGGYKQDWMADIHRVLKPFYDAGVDGFKWLNEIIKHKVTAPDVSNSFDSYLKNGPLRDIEPKSNNSNNHGKPYYTEEIYYENGKKMKRVKWHNLNYE